MLIENPDALKSWLVVILEPLCDADSSALARYVLALLKKDKPEIDLKRVMIEQLDVFLGDETRPFVDTLFSAIGSGGYLMLPAPSTDLISLTLDDSAAGIVNATAPANTRLDADNDAIVIHEAMSIGTISSQNDAVAAVSVVLEEKLQTAPCDEIKAKETHINNNRKSTDTAPSTERPAAAVVTALPTTPTGAVVHAVGVIVSGSHSSPTRPAIADKENQPRESRRRRASQRSRSRSRSNERLSRRSRSRDRRINEREKNQRAFRNKSPPSAAEQQRHVGSHERRRGGGDRRRTAGGGGGGADDRSPRFGAGGEGRKTRQNRSNSRSRSPSQERVRSKASPTQMRPSRAGVGGGGAGGGANSPDRERERERQMRHSGGGGGGGGGVHLPHEPQQIQPHVYSHEHEKRKRCRDFDEKGYCVRGETCPWDHGINPVVFEGINNPALIPMSLREYNPDSPDLWLRSANSGPAGAMVPPPPQLTAGGAVGAGVIGAGGSTGINPFSGTARTTNNGLLGTPTNGVLPLPAEYARPPNAGAGGPGGAGVLGFRNSAAMLQFPFNPAAVTTPLQRELIPIPVVDAGAGAGGDVGAMQQHQLGKRRYELEDSVAIAEGPAKRKLPLNSRLGPRPQNMQNNCSLELRKVPRGLNSIAHLNNHFAKFGKIVNIQISYDGDPEAATVTFSTHAEANVAYRSTEAVLNNRFIKVFWHSGLDAPGGGGGGASGGDMVGSTSAPGGRKNSQYHLNNVPAIPTPAADSAKICNTTLASQAGGGAGTGTNPASGSPADAANAIAPPGTTNAVVVAATHVPPPSLRLKNNVQPRGASNAIIRKKQEEQAKAVVQLANGLRKRKQELLQSYVKQMKTALELVERCDQNDAQRAKTLSTIKVLQETIDKLQKEIAAEQEQMQAQIANQNHATQPLPAKKTKEQQKKELLDIELELFAQQQEGNDTTAIQRRLEELQRSIGIVPGSAALHAAALSSSSGPKMAPHYNRSGQRGRAAAFHEGSTRVDRRPKTIVVTGFTGEEADYVLGHFKHFGEISKHDMDRDIPQLILSYATRNSAEQAVVRGKLFKDKRLQISWAPTVPATPIVTFNASLHDNAKANTSALDGKSMAMATDANATAADGLVVGAAKHRGGMESLSNRLGLGGGANHNDTLPELRLEDEEEDEECEDRSWRR